MADEKNLELAMSLIANGGDARSQAMLAIKAAKSGDFEKSLLHLDQAKRSLVVAHKHQTDLLVAEANDQAGELTLLMIHAQDHLMNAMTVNDLAIEMVELYQTISTKSQNN